MRVLNVSSTFVTIFLALMRLQLHTLVNVDRSSCTGCW